MRTELSISAYNTQYFYQKQYKDDISSLELILTSGLYKSFDLFIYFSLHMVSVLDRAQPQLYR